MAQFLNMYPVELSGGTAPNVSLNRIHQGDHKANRVGAIVLMDGIPYPVGGNCAGTAIRADGSTVPLTGTVDGNLAYVELDSECYQVEGTITVHVKWVSGTLETTLLSAIGTVELTESGNVIQPSTPIPDLPQLMAQITAMQEATAAAEAAATKAVRYDSTQSLTEAQKTTARGNIDAVSTGTFDNLSKATESAGVSTIKTFPHIQQGYITTDTILWNDRISGGNRCAIIPVSAGQAVSVTGGGLYTMIAALKTFNSPATGDTPDFSAASGWTSTIRVNAGETFTGTIPADAAYLYVWLGNISYDLPRSPASVIVGGYDYAKSGADNIRDRAQALEMSAALGTKPEMSLSGISTVPSGADLDNYLTPGTYYINSTSTAANVAHLPAEGTPGKLFVSFIHSATRVLQLYITYNSADGAYFRTIVIRDGGNTVNSWHQYALTDSPAFTGSPTAPTQNAGDNSTKLATTAYSDASSAAAADAMKTVIDTALLRKPELTLTTATRIQPPDANTNADLNDYLTPGTYYIATAADAGRTDNLPATAQNTTGKIIVLQLSSSTRYMQIFITSLSAQGMYFRTYYASTGGWNSWHQYALTDSPAFTGTPTAPTQEAGDNSTKLATTAYVDRASAGSGGPQNIRIMQYNCGVWAMGGGSNGVPMTPENVDEKLLNYKKMLCQYRPDIIGIEEWMDTVALSNGATISMNTRVFDALYPYNVDFIYSGSSKGRTLKAKYALTDTSTGTISASSYGGSANVLYSKAHMVIGGRSVCAVCTAVSPSTHNAGDPAIRATLLPMLLALLDGEDYAFLIIDMNNGGNGSDVSDIDEGNSLNAIAQANGFMGCMGPYLPWEDTWRSQASVISPPIEWKAIDQIFYRNNGKIIFNNWTVLVDEFDKLNSDHIPVFGDFTLL